MSYHIYLRVVVHSDIFNERLSYLRTRSKRLKFRMETVNRYLFSGGDTESKGLIFYPDRSVSR